MEAGGPIQPDSQFVLLAHIYAGKIPIATQRHHEQQSGECRERSIKAPLILPQIWNLLVSSLTLVLDNVQPLTLLLSRFSNFFSLSSLYFSLCLLNLQSLGHPAAFDLLGWTTSWFWSSSTRQILTSCVAILCTCFIFYIFATCGWSELYCIQSGGLPKFSGMTIMLPFL